MPIEPANPDEVADALDTIKAIDCRHCSKVAVVTAIVPTPPQWMLHYRCLSCGKHTLALLDMPQRVAVARSLPPTRSTQRGH